MIAVHDRFVTWFYWAFMNAALCGGFVCCAACMLLCAEGCVPVCLGLAGCTQCSTLIWYFVGIVWRFNEVGRFATGNIVPENMTEEDWEKFLDDPKAAGNFFQRSSGNFMYSYFMITWILMGTMCCCGCVLAIFSK